jgi:hypothetical protein
MEAAPTADVDPATAAAMQRDMRRVDTRLVRRGHPEPGTPVDHVHVGTRERRRRCRAERAARAAGAHRAASLPLQCCPDGPRCFSTEHRPGNFQAARELGHCGRRVSALNSRSR